VLWRDRYVPVAAPAWLAERSLPIGASELAESDLLHYDWKNSSLQGPTWGSWMEAAGLRGFDTGRCIGFSEESHAIQAALDGAGVCLASTVLVGHELRTGHLVQVHPLGLNGFAYHAEYVDDHPRLPLVHKIVNWLGGLLADEPDGPTGARAH
jgi:LysR family glycine cleavage system transcriptional activator